MKSISILALIFGIIVLNSCGSKKNIVYFQDLPRDTLESVTSIINNVDPKIQPGDLLDIKISTLDPATNALFNNGVLPSSENAETNMPAAAIKEGYLVDQYGSIVLPEIGKVMVGGLTKAEAKLIIEKEVARYAKNPIVSIKFLNFRITVMGEVNNPGTFNVATEKINVIEALALAGDMTPYGERDNILLFREENGNRVLTRLNFKTSELFNSPYFYLKQGDVLVIEGKKIKDPAGERQFRTATLGIGLVGIASSITTLIITLSK